VICFDLYGSSNNYWLIEAFVGHAPFSKSLTHLTHKHKISLRQKAAPVLDCNNKVATMG